VLLQLNSFFICLNASFASCRWFCGFMSYDKAESLLEKKNIGTYLVRFSGDDPHTLSLSYHSFKEVKGGSLIEQMRIAEVKVSALSARLVTKNFEYGDLMEFQQGIERALDAKLQKTLETFASEQTRNQVSFNIRPYDKYELMDLEV